jgi:hypothetical protein
MIDCRWEDKEKGVLSMTTRQRIIQRMAYRLIRSILEGDAMHREKYILVMEVADGLPESLASEVYRYDWPRLVGAVMREIRRDMICYDRDEYIKIEEWLKRDYRR